MGEWVGILKSGEIEEGRGQVVESHGKCLAVFKVNGCFHVIDNTCVHRGGPLGEGDLEGEVVSCPWHGWEYNVKTGQCLNNPAGHVKTYPSRVEGEEVQVEL
jgi:nitrite reductase (NADH) small subunit